MWVWEMRLVGWFGLLWLSSLSICYPHRARRLFSSVLCISWGCLCCVGLWLFWLVLLLLSLKCGCRDDSGMVQSGATQVYYSPHSDRRTWCGCLLAYHRGAWRLLQSGSVCTALIVCTTALLVWPFPHGPFQRVCVSTQHLISASPFWFSNLNRPIGLKIFDDHWLISEKKICWLGGNIRRPMIGWALVDVGAGIFPFPDVPVSVIKGFFCGWWR